jgi:hypothetical protein
MVLRLNLELKVDVAIIIRLATFMAFLLIN